MINSWNSSYFCLETDEYSRIDFILDQAWLGHRMFKIKKIDDNRYLMMFRPFILDEYIASIKAHGFY